MYNGIATYFEDTITSADPMEMVRMLYRGAIDAVEKARHHLRAGDIASRSAEITKAGAILAHLSFSVKPEADPLLAGNLVELYDYMQRRLLRANLEQADAPLAEVAGLLATLLEAWMQCEAGEPALAEPVPAGMLADAEPVAEYAGHSWSF